MYRKKRRIFTGEGENVKNVAAILKPFSSTSKLPRREILGRSIKLAVLICMATIFRRTTTKALNGFVRLLKMERTQLKLCLACFISLAKASQRIMWKALNGSVKHLSWERMKHKPC